MQAVICTQYGPPEVLQLADVAAPTPKSNEVRIKLRATAVTASDCIVRGFKLPPWRPMGFMMGLVIGFGKPRNPILGMVYAGDIDAIGSGVTAWQVGDPVWGLTVKSPTQMHFGTYAEYKCLPQDSLMVRKPANVSYQQAAAAPYGGHLALLFLQKGGIANGQNVLVYGASGAIGTAAVQLARAFGATVTGVCSTRNVDLVRSLGAQSVLDYTQPDAADGLGQYDLVLDAVGKAKTSPLKEQAQNALTPQGQYISVDSGSPNPRQEHLDLLGEWLATGQFKPVIDRTYPLAEIVAAHRYVDGGHKSGSVVITIGPED